MQRLGLRKPQESFKTQAGNTTQIDSCVLATRHLKYSSDADSITGGGLVFRYRSAAQQQRGVHDVGLHANNQAQL